MNETELRDLIRDEAGKYLPFDNMDDVNYDFQFLVKIITIPTRWILLCRG